MRHLSLAIVLWVVAATSTRAAAIQATEINSPKCNDKSEFLLIADNSCRTCPHGSYLRENGHPDTARLPCESCPPGTHGATDPSQRISVASCVACNNSQDCDIGIAIDAEVDNYIRTIASERKRTASYNEMPRADKTRWPAEVMNKEVDVQVTIRLTMENCYCNSFAVLNGNRKKLATPAKCSQGTDEAVARNGIPWGSVIVNWRKRLHLESLEDERIVIHSPMQPYTRALIWNVVITIEDHRVADVDITGAAVAPRGKVFQRDDLKSDDEREGNFHVPLPIVLQSTTPSKFKDSEYGRREPGNMFRREDPAQTFGDSQPIDEAVAFAYIPDGRRTAPGIEFSFVLRDPPGSVLGENNHERSRARPSPPKAKPLTVNEARVGVPTLDTPPYGGRKYTTQTTPDSSPGSFANHQALGLVVVLVFAAVLRMWCGCRRNRGSLPLGARDPSL